MLVAQQAVANSFKNKKIFSILPVKQDKSKEIRYTKNCDFNDSIIKEFLQRKILIKSDVFKYPKLFDPFFG